MKRAYGYIPDKLDARDRLYTEKVVHRATPPRQASVEALMPPVVDQGQLGSCTGNGIAAVVDFLHVGKSLVDWIGPSSRLQIYYDERVIEGTVRQDAGAEIRDGIKVVNKTGAALEKLWPYTVSKFKTKPTPTAYKDAANRKVKEYLRLLSLADMVDCIASGFPFVFGFSVPSNFEDDAIEKTGYMTWDKKQQTVGGHCVAAVGYDLDKNMFRCRNSWGTSWGDKGHFWMPVDYISDSRCASDFWKVSK